MKEYPILFQPDMVRGILEGRKTQTRRLTGLKEINQHPNNWEYFGCFVDMQGELINQFFNRETGIIHNLKCPYGAEGSVLWTRETYFSGYKLDEYDRVPEGAPLEYWYRADTFDPRPGNASDHWCAHMYGIDKRDWPKWKPSIHMPKDACRIYQQNTGVRVQRLQDISEEDAIAEGIECQFEHEGVRGYKNYLHGKLPCPQIVSFRTLIEKINGPEIWGLNPWVRAISFRVLSTTGRPDNLEELCAAL